MPVEPQIKPLSTRRRTVVFWFFLLLFMTMLPIIVFYTTGYRFDFEGFRQGNIVSTGGLYVNVQGEDMEIYVDETQVLDARVFRRASYIQNLEAGMHRVHVQGDGLQTWVKELPVRERIVTEVQAFNLPVVPQIRLVAPYQTADGLSTFPGVASTTVKEAFSFASSTQAVFASTTIATTTLVVHEEYTYVRSLFGSTTATSSETLVSRVVQEMNDALTFPAASTSTATTTATTSVTSRNVKLFESEGEVFAAWVGNQNDIPYYFCVDYESASSTAALYGEHVYESLASSIASMPMLESDEVSQRLCRSEIRIDRLRQDVIDFDFVPGSTDFVLMLLEEGLYVVEIDDRSWQNAQILYPGKNLKLAVDGGRIFIADGRFLVEVYTELQVEPQ
jgi:hypothetical protein